MAAFHMDRHPFIVYVKASAPFQGAAIGGDYLRGSPAKSPSVRNSRFGLSPNDFLSNPRFHYL